MITNEVQYRSTKAHLEQFEEAAANLEKREAHGGRTKLAQLEIDAVRSQGEDLRGELREYERLRAGEELAMYNTSSVN